MARYAFAVSLMMLQQGVIEAEGLEELKESLQRRLQHGDGSWKLSAFKVEEATVQVVEVVPATCLQVTPLNECQQQSA